MDILFEFIVELIFEGSIEISSNKKINYKLLEIKNSTANKSCTILYHMPKYGRVV